MHLYKSKKSIFQNIHFRKLYHLKKIFSKFQVIWIKIIVISISKLDMSVLSTSVEFGHLTSIPLITI